MDRVPELFDADALVKRVTRLHQSLAREARGSDLELYHRAARTIRVGVQGRHRNFTTQQGYDEGVALRATSRDWDGLSFAAGSGSSTASLRWVLDRCRRPSMSLPQKWMWARDAEALKTDRDGEPRLPPVEQVQAWLERSRDALSAGESSRPELLELSVEITATVESWVADGGLRASRTRSRSWGLMRLVEPWAGDRAGQPVLIARRSWDDLPVDGWRTVLEDRRLPDLPEKSAPAAAVPVLFSPECSAVLVAALVKTLNASGADRQTTVGPAWRITDDPQDPGALFGGSFDDAGFATRRRRLADGRVTHGRIEGRGHYRRPSFRDPPQSLPSNLVVTSTDRGAPQRGVVATSLELHPVEPERWLLQIEGALLERGQPVATLRPSFVSVSPADLVGRCVSSVGPPRFSHLGVKTPALVFDNLSLHS
jgi:predicted Zn-dependent protease